MRALVVVADGFEEIEFSGTVDVLRRGGIETVTAAAQLSTQLNGAHGIVMCADSLLQDVFGEFDAIVFPGGYVNSQTLAADVRVRQLAEKYHACGKWICALCASPALVLSPLGMLKGKKVTCHPSLLDELDAIVTEGAVVTDFPFITSRGPGTTLAFGLEIVRQLRGEEVARELAENMLVTSF